MSRTLSSTRLADADPMGLVDMENRRWAVDLMAALGGISAKVLVIGFGGDPMFNPEDGERYASWTPGSRFLRIDSEFGHLATFSLSQKDVAIVDDELRALLAS